MFLDRVEITIKAGDGGNGHTSFHRDAITARGGPDGGDGGHGGDVVFAGTNKVDNLVSFRFTKKFTADSGANGKPRMKTGAMGKELVIEVPLGTKIYKHPVTACGGATPLKQRGIPNAEDNACRVGVSGELLADITEDGQRYVALKGGAGGRGNARFATSRRQTPNFSHSGVKTIAHNVVLELNCIADVGIIGFPNVGKSTLLSVVTRANPKIGNYHFTTIHPNIGVYNAGGAAVILADIPGLIEGAATGTGLGIDFLKHINRTRLLVHVVDISEQDGRDALRDFEIINAELGAFSKSLLDKPQIVALNKCEMADKARIDAFKKQYAKKYKVFEISAATHTGVKELMQHVAAEVAKLPKTPAEIATAELEGWVDKNTFEVVIESDGGFRVAGPLVDNLIRGVVLSDTESNAYFQRRLVDSGVIAALKDAGMREGDTVRIADVEFEWVD